MTLCLYDNLREPSKSCNHIVAFIVKELELLENEGFSIDGEHYFVEVSHFMADDPGKFISFMLFIVIILACHIL